MQLLEKLEKLKHVRAETHTSEKYINLSTKEMIQPLLDKGYELTGVKIRNSKVESRLGHQFHTVRLRQPNAPKVGDSFPEIVISNSYDGTSSFVVYFGIYRLVCSNGLVVGKNLVEPIRVKHVGQDAPIRVLDAVAKIEAQLSKVSALIERGHKVSICDPITWATKLLKSVHPELDKLTTLPLNRSGDLDNSWATFNLVQENLCREGGLRGLFKVVNDETGEIELKEKAIRVRKGTQSDLEINQKLFDAYNDFLAAA